MAASTFETWSLSVPSDENTQFIMTKDLLTDHSKMLKEVLHKIVEVNQDPLESLKMIDLLQRLGIDYHYHEMIHVILESQYMRSSDPCHDLFEAALRFRLLRQEGYFVRADEYFKVFRDEEGKFVNRLEEDIYGLIELYEASQLCIEGEDILDDAAVFSLRVLKELLPNLDDQKAKIVATTLDHPYHKNSARFMAKNFFVNFQGSASESSLVELATMDFLVVQSVHQREILEVSKWWVDLGLAGELQFARDQPLKWYLWSMASLTDPKVSWQRIELVKPISLVYVIDDLFDVHGTLSDLVMFTDAVNRWDFAFVEGLPDSVKLCFKALQDITSEIAYKVHRDYGWNPIDSLRKAWAKLCNAFLVEAKWFALGELPKAEEYLKNGIISSGVPLVLAHMFFLLGKGIDKKCIDLVDQNSSFISSISTILRLWDDLGSAQDENQNGNDGSYIECYMKEHLGSSLQEARTHVIQLIEDTWKRLNRECLSPNPFPAPFIKACLNAARMVPLMYNYDHNHNLPGLKEYMNSTL